ncbi:MAG: EAL domain-containing protein [Actinomycetota bacterium]
MVDMTVDEPQGTATRGTLSTAGNAAALDLALSVGRMATFEYDMTIGPLWWSGPLAQILCVETDRVMTEAALVDLLRPIIALPVTALWDQYVLEQELGERRVRIHVQPSAPDRLVGAIVDITDQHASHRDLDDLVERYRLLVDFSPDGIVVHQAGHVVYCNPAALRFIKSSKTIDLVGSPITDFVHPDFRPAMMARIAGLTSTGSVTDAAEVLLICRDGSTLVVETTSVRTTWLGAPAYQVILRDVSERKAAASALAFQATLVHHVSDAIVAIAADGTVTSWNPAAEAIYGWPREQVLGRPISDIFEQSLPADGKRAELVHRRQDGQTVDVAISVGRLVDGSGAGVGSVIVCSDITERKRALAALWHESRQDGLTGLANRTLVLEKLEATLLDCQRSGKHATVVFLDLDHFKIVNDSLGHGAGDDVLRVVATRLSASVAEGDTVARLGGDEFVVIARRRAGESADQLASRLRTVVAQPMQLGSRRVVVNASAGIVVTNGSSAPTTAAEVLRDADVAMYQAKAHGRDRHEVFDSELRQQALRRLQMEDELRSAIHTAELWLAFQPVFSLRSGRATSTEALLRWTSQTFGNVTPAEFIPIAEESGLIVVLGRRVLELACAQTAAWRASHVDLADLQVAVNLSARQLTDPEIVNDVSATLAAHGLPAAALRLEITESMLMDDAEAAARTLASLSELGVRLSIDDFGTGYSSLAYLTRFRVHELKIDRSFVDGMGRSQNDAAVVASVISLAHTLGLDVVAEGVETSEQLRALRLLNCDAVQGYYLARPTAPADTFPVLLERSPMA